MWRIASRVIASVAAILGVLLMVRVDACPAPMSLLEYFRAYGFYVISSPLRATFLGVSTLVFDDGVQAIMTDGFFSRPTLGFPVSITAVTPNDARIDAVLEQMQITTMTQRGALSLVGIVVNHSHYDHAMDSSVVADRTGALLVGSSSTANVARGRAFPEDRLRVISGGESFCVGRFRASFVRTGHVPLPFSDVTEGEITEPTVLQTVGDYKEGGTFAVFVQYSGRGRTILVQGSAGFTPGALQGRSANVVYLAVGGLSLPSNSAHRDSYWNEVVAMTAPQRVVPIHWDSLMGELTDALAPSTDGASGISFVEGRGQAAGIDVRRPTALQKVAPFEGL